jgi:SSS family solute:Na+ symporter
MQSLATQDYIVFLLYFVIIVGYAFWIYNRKKKAQTSSNDYFLAEGSLTWWAIGASLIASNISADCDLRMDGGSNFNHRRRFLHARLSQE